MNRDQGACPCRSFRGSLFALSLAVAVLAACAPAPTPPLPGSFIGIEDAEALEAHLEEGGLELSPIGEAVYAWFDEPARTYEVGPDRADALFVHVFGDAAAARAAARRVSPDGRRIVSDEGEEILVEWLGVPHVFRSGPLLVVYVGTSPEALALLQDALGPPFAGASTLPAGP